MPNWSAFSEEIGGFYRGATMNYRQGLRVAKLFGSGRDSRGMASAMLRNMRNYYDPMQSSVNRVAFRGAMTLGAGYGAYRVGRFGVNNTVNSDNRFIRNASRLGVAGLGMYGLRNGMAGSLGAAGRYARQHAWYRGGGVQRAGYLGRMISR